jgi:hypothetical protein
MPGSGIGSVEANDAAAQFGHRMDATVADELRKEADRHHCESVYRMRWNGPHRHNSLIRNNRFNLWRLPKYSRRLDPGTGDWWGYR